ncbi:major capsid protein [Streptomyces syringium]|uniref:major capsid protein n=1 Tax=Streptomyces syringium TaxID=76729 RepID=UPI00344A1F9A
MSHAVSADAPHVAAILGGDADVDKFIVQTRGNLNDRRAIQTAMKVKAASVHFADQFFNGDVEVNPKGFDGLRKRLLGSQVLDAKGSRTGYQRS